MWLLLAVGLAVAAAPGDRIAGAATDGEGRPADVTGGSVTVLNLWATWCGPCRAELPLLDQLHASLAADGARVVALSLDASRARASAVASHLGLSLPVLFDGGPLAEVLAPEKLPTTYVVDRDGVIRHVHPGALDGSQLAKVAEEARALLAAPEGE